MAHNGGKVEYWKNESLDQTFSKRERQIFYKNAIDGGFCGCARRLYRTLRALATENTDLDEDAVNNRSDTESNCIV